MKLIFIEFIIASQLLFAQLPSYDISEVNVSKFSSSISVISKKYPGTDNGPFHLKNGFRGVSNLPFSGYSNIT